MYGDPVGPAKPEHRGYLRNEYTGNREYVVLRGSVLRARQSKHGPETSSLYLTNGSSVSLLAGRNALEVQSKVPFPREIIWAASSEREAEAWHDAIQASIRAEQAEMDRLVKLLENGCTMHKYNYSNSKRSRRYFWVDDSGRELCWGRVKGDQKDETQKVNLRECIGIIYGPMTTTFQRCVSIDDPAWSCFSLLFMGRTLDLTVSGDLQVRAWFLGMQHLISLHGIGNMPMMSDAQFIARKVQYKLMAVAHQNHLVLGRYLLERIRAVAKSRSAQTETSKASCFAPSKREKRCESADKGTVGRLAELKEEALHLQVSWATRNMQAEVANTLLKQTAHAASADLGAVLKEAALDTLKRRCATLDEETSRLSAEAEELGPQVKAQEKTERSLRKIQQKLEDTESRRQSVQLKLSTARTSAEVSSGLRTKSSSVEAEATMRGEELKQRIQDLERQLCEAKGRHSEMAILQNQRQAEAIQTAERDRLALQQQVEAVGRNLEKVKEAERESAERLVRMQEVTHKLDSAIAPLLRAAKHLREEQCHTRREVFEVAKGFGGDIQKAVDGTGKMFEHDQALQAKYKQAMEDRKKLHNQVLDLKGNIRVFVRVRPINAKEAQCEPEGEPTMNFRDNTNIGVFDSQHGRRKWFEFDQVFDPSTRQEQVFEEAKPLATSVLDGYNVCIFAYGQTGSGKTHTMAGTAADPGMNTRVLRELFQIRDERAGEYTISISLAITEIYNETVRDLLNPSSSKKLDVKQSADGSCGVPGLLEENVASVEDVMTCIDRASKNRAVSSTDMNEQSSRSHSIVTVRTNCTLNGNNTYVGKIHLIDLAGSENTNKSGVTGQGMKEAQNINKSLSALGDVIQSLVAKNPHTPYRNSKLTMMLKDSLGGDSKTLMIVCTSPAQFNASETISSLNFAARARNVELGKAKRNVAG